ncbi:hypothetical protein LQW54_011260 [Pestalotiopsis sp. IQ-011]
MVYTVIALLRRRSDITPEQFRTHYDTVHIALLKSLVGADFPLTHVRNYVSFSPGGGDGSADTTMMPTLLAKDSVDNHFFPVVLQGKPSDITFDVVTVMTWEDEQAHQRFAKRFASDLVTQEINADEENFLDRDHKLVFTVIQPVVTQRG